MKYQDHVGQMLEHLIQNNNAENVEACVNALCHAIVGVVAHSVPDHDHMHNVLAGLHEEMQKQACELHDTVWQQESHKEEPEEQPAQPQPMDSETFLRDHFKPEHFNA